MISKLPAWIGLGAFLLTCAAGCVNAFMLLGMLHEPVAHLSGTTTNFAIALAQGSPSTILHLLMLIVSFITGAIISGLIIRDSHLKLGRRYGVVLMIETVILIIVQSFFSTHPRSGQYWLSLACGLQNAMATTYSGAVVRTTHLTGVFTDFGILIGNWFAGIPIQRAKAGLFGALIGGYLAGGFFCGLLYFRIESSVLFLPITITGLLSVTYFAYWIHQHRSPAAQ